MYTLSIQYTIQNVNNVCIKHTLYTIQIIRTISPFHHTLSDYIVIMTGITLTKKLKML